MSLSQQAEALGFCLQPQPALQKLSKDHRPRDPGSIAAPLERLHDKEVQVQHDSDITEPSPICPGDSWNPSMTVSRLALLQGHTFFFSIKNFRRNDPGVTHKLNDQEKDEMSGPLAPVTHALPRSARAL